LEVTEGLQFGHKRLLTQFGRGGSVQGFGQPILVGHHPESVDPVFVWFLHPSNFVGRVFRGVLGRGNCRSFKGNGKGDGRGIKFITFILYLAANFKLNLNEINPIIMKTMYQFLSSFLFLWFINTAVAQNIQTTLGSFNSTSFTVGDTITLPVNVSMVAGISTAAISMAIDYDTSKLRCISTVTGLNSNISAGFLSNCGLFSRLSPNPPFTANSRRQFRAAWFNLAPVAFNGLMFNVRFVVLATGNSILKWDVATPGNCEYADELTDVIWNCSFVVDDFKSDFYKESNDYKNNELKFQKTDEYFKKRILEAINQSKSSGLSLEKEFRMNCEYARKKYLEENPDVKNANIDPWRHYNTYGEREGRKWYTCENQNNNFILKTSPTYYEFQSLLILDSLITENPPISIKNDIESVKVNIIKSFLYRNLYDINLSWEKYVGLNLKYRDFNKIEIHRILDSIRTVIIEKEIVELKNNKDLIEFMDLFAHADSSFKAKLLPIRIEIETAFLENITKSYDFEKIAIIEKKDTTAAHIRKYQDLKTSLEKSLVALLDSNYDPVLFDKMYNIISIPARFELDKIRKREEPFYKFKTYVRKIENHVSFSRFEEALALISQIEVNPYPSESSENISIRRFKNIAFESFVKIKISESIRMIKDEAQNGRVRVVDINGLLNNSVSYRSDVNFGNKDRVELNYSKGRSILLFDTENKAIFFSESDLSQNQRNELISLRKKELIRLEAYKQEELERNRLNSRNSEHTNSNAQNKSPELELCTTESGYDYVRNTKMSFYKGGLVEISLDNGEFKYGRFSTNNGSVYINVRGFPAIVLEPAYGNNFIDRQGHEWRPCWY